MHLSGPKTGGGRGGGLYREMEWPCMCGEERASTHSGLMPKDKDHKDGDGDDDKEEEEKRDS